MQPQQGAFLLLTLACLFVAQTDAGLTPQSCLSHLKNMVMDKFRAGLEQTAVVKEFRDAAHRIEQQYIQAAEQGLYDPNNAVEAEKYYYQIAMSEVRRMRQSGVVAGQLSQVDKNIEGYACPVGQNSGDDDADYDMMDMDLDDTGAESIGLENKLEQLEELNRHLEPEMGWSMTPEARERMHRQAKELAREVLTNEIRDLAFAAVTGFMTGGVGGAVGPVWMAVSGTLKIKVVKYFMQMMLDILSTYLGHPIELKETTPKAAAA